VGIQTRETIAMLRNYLKIAFRNLSRHKTSTFINIIGLAGGITVCLVIFLIIQYQTSFDNFHEKKDRVYRILTTSNQSESATVSLEKNVPFPMPSSLQTAFPQLEEVATVYASHNDEIQVLNDNGTAVRKFKEQNGVFYTEPSFFRIFDFPLLSGSHASLKEPNNVLLSKETAERYFGDWRNAMGRTIKLTGTYRMGAGLFQFPPVALTISGILASVPSNTDFQMNLVIAYGTNFTGDREYGFQTPDWNQTSPDHSCYVLLPVGMRVENFNQQLNAFAQKVHRTENKDSYIAQSLSGIHFDTEAGNFSNKTISRELISVLWLIAAFILLIACVNFVNLSSAQAINRAKEVGVRKVLGSSRSQLQLQFLTETFLIVAAALILAMLTALLALPAVKRLLELSLSLNPLLNPSFVLFAFTVVIGLTLLAGFYPSLILSRFNPAHALKNKIATGTFKGVSLRRGLVVFQFVIAQALIIGTIIIVKQMDYFMEQPLGFEKNAVVNVPFRPDSTGSRLTDYLKQQLLSVKGVEAVSFNSHAPVDDGDEMWTSFKFNRASEDADFQAILKFADDQYASTYKLPLVAGRNLQPSAMTREFLVNESFAKTLGYSNPESILNKEVSMWNGLIKCNIVGVLKDFSDRPFHHELAPLIITTNNTMYRQATVKLSTTNISSTMESVKDIWEQTFPDYVYEFRFLDEKIASFYKQENQLAQLYKIFAAIAIFLSCLGLYGLASFMAVQRTKEVGIRKVLGATAGNIVYLFSREFVILITIAFAIASPLAWYYMQQWLQDYAYRVDISWWIFAAGGLIAIVIALITISFQAVRAAMANPVNSLKSD
jgi:predicted permease